MQPTFKICHNNIYLHRNHPSPSTATCTTNQTYRTQSPKLRLLLVSTRQAFFKAHLWHELGSGNY